MVFKRFKTDKKFRRNVIIGIIIFLFIINAQNKQELQAVTQAECNQYNSLVNEFFGLNGQSDYSECQKLGCKIEVFPAKLSGFLIPFNTAARCVSCVESGKYTYAQSNCCSGSAVELGLSEKITHCGDILGTCYKCTDVGKCEGWQKPFASILDSVWKGNNFDCSVKAYIVIGLGVFMILMVI